MAITRGYTYVGKIKNPFGEEYHIYEGVYNFEAADEYDQDARPTLTFAGISRVVGVIGIQGFADDPNNLGNPAAMLSIATNVVTLMVMESGTGSAGLDEKTDDEAYGVDGAIRCTVFGQ